MVGVQTSASMILRRRLGVLSTLGALLLVTAACHPASRLLVENRSSTGLLLRIEQKEIGPLVFDVPAGARGWVVHSVDGYLIEGDISLLTLDCRTVDSWQRDGFVVIDGDGMAALDELPPPEEAPDPNARLSRTEKCGG